MSTLTQKEIVKLEKLFDMKSGYVLDFSNRTFGNFFHDEVDIDIHSEKYGGYGLSKANKLRAFWSVESDYIVGKCIADLITEMRENNFKEGNYTSILEEKKELVAQCEAIANRLLSGQVNLNHLKITADKFDAKHLAEQIKRIENSIEQDPALAIGTAKELIETCCKTILLERGKPIEGTPDIPTLTKATLKELKLVPDDIHEKSKGSDLIKRILQNLGSIGNGLAELRGLYGTGHGKYGKTKGLQVRHAKLAVGTSVTLVNFLFDTHEETKHLLKNKEVA